MHAAPGTKLQVQVVKNQLLVSLGLAVALWVVLAGVIGYQFLELHRRQLAEDISRINASIDRRMMELARSAAEFSEWPAAGKLLQDAVLGNEEGEISLPMEVLQRVGVDFIAVLDGHGVPASFKMSGATVDEEASLLKALGPYLQVGNGLLPVGKGNGSGHAIFPWNGDIYLFGASAIRPYSPDGASANAVGWVVFGQRVDRDLARSFLPDRRIVVARLIPATQQEIESPGQYVPFDSPFLARKVVLRKAPVWSRTDTLLVPFPDPNGRMSAALQVVSEKQLLLTAMIFIVFAGAAAIGVVGVGGIVNYHYVGRYVMRRLATLGQEVAEVTALKDTSRRVMVHNDDEVGVLANAINSMLDRVEQAQRAAEETNARYRAAVEQAVEGIFLASRDGLRFVEINKAMRSMLGLRDTEPAPESLYDLELAPPELVDKWIVRLEAGEAPVYIRRTLHRRTSATLEVGVTLGLLRYSNQTQILGVVHDVQEEDRIEAAMQEAKRLESVGQLAGGVAHDFNNLLTVILNGVETIRSSATAPDKVRANLEMVVRAANNAAELTRKLLYFSRRSTTNPKPASLNHLLQEMRSIIRSVVRENVRIDFSLAPGLPNCLLDSKAIEQSILNLVLNAKDAIAADGRIAIRTGHCTLRPGQLPYFPELPKGEYVYVEISDSGNGIPPEIMAHLFEPFQTSKEIGQGTGLGLPMVHGIVEGHGGGIDVVTARGTGTTFRLYFPSTAASAVESPPASEPMDSDPLHAESAAILVAEDQPDIRDLISLALEADGHRVTAKENGELAMQYALGRKIDLLVTDVVMPGSLSGYDLALELIRMDPEIRVIVMSGYDQQQGNPGSAATAVLRRENARFIAKPFTNAQLRALVSELLGGRNLPSDSANEPLAPLTRLSPEEGRD